MRILVEYGVGIAALLVIDRLGPHPAIVLLAMAVVLHWAVSSNGSNLSVFRVMFVGSLLSYLLYSRLLDVPPDQFRALLDVEPGRAVTGEQSLWALGGTVAGWVGVVLAYAGVMPLADRTAFRWRLRTGRSSATDVRDLLVKHRHWGQTGKFEQVTIRAALKDSQVEPATVGCWYHAGETPTRLAVALMAGIGDQGLRAHASGTSPLDWPTVETLAALRRPL